MTDKFYSPYEYYTEEEKDSEDYLVTCIDNAIAELVIEKDYLLTAYNYYNGIRDEEQFRYLEENYGIGNPTSVEFIPLIRRHVDALIGEHLQNKLKPKISCKDKKTLGKIAKQRSEVIYKSELDRLQSQLYANITHMITPESRDNGQPPQDKASEQDLSKMKEDIARDFLSEYEISAQNMLTHVIQNKNINLVNKRRILFGDLLIGGQCYYSVNVGRKGEMPSVKVHNTFDTFIDELPDSQHVNHSPRSVVREWMYREQILNEFGGQIKNEDLDSVFKYHSDGPTANMQYARTAATAHMGGLVAGVGATIGHTNRIQNGREYTNTLIPVYRVEWLATNKIEVDGETIYRMDRYKGVRIGGEIYVNMGKDEDVVRTIEHPYDCKISLNGMIYSNRNGRPYSLVLACKKLQDKYDVLHFYRDTLIANSGVKGDWLDTSTLPTFLGATPAERILKFKAYKKQGIALTNTAQEGRGANHNTIFAGFDDTVPGQAIQAIQFAIQQTEDTCSGITGVFRERLGNIEQHDAVTNVEVGIQTSATITKQYYQVMDSVTTDLLIDTLNACKIAFKDGMMGSIILGDQRQKIFTINPKHFSFTDYDIHISDSSDIIRDMQDIKMLTMEMLKGGIAEADMVVEAITTESLTEMKDVVLKSYGKKKEENSQLQQMQQALQQAQEQLQQIQQQAEQIQAENEQLKAKSYELDAKKIEYDYDVKKEANKNANDFNTNKIELDKSRIELEKLQLFDESKDNDEIQNA